MSNTLAYLAAAVLLVLHHANASSDPDSDYPYQPSGRVKTFDRGDEAWQVAGDEEKTIYKVTCEEYVCSGCKNPARWMCTEHMRYADEDAEYDDDNVYHTTLKCEKSFLRETCRAETVVLELGLFCNVVTSVVGLVALWAILDFLCPAIK